MDDVFCSCYHPCTAHSLLCRASHLACAPLHYLYMSAHVCAFIIIKICDRLGASCNGRGFIVNSWDEMYVDSQSVGRCVTGAPRSLHAVVDSKHRQKQFSYSSISVDCFHTRTGRQSVRERQRERERGIDRQTDRQQIGVDCRRIMHARSAALQLLLWWSLNQLLLLLLLLVVVVVVVCCVCYAYMYNAGRQSCRCAALRCKLISIWT